MITILLAMPLSLAATKIHFVGPSTPILIDLLAKWGKGKPLPTECNDGIDNDGDTYIDLADPGCRNKQDKSELNPKIECDDGVDNDNDTYIDYPDDPECNSPLDDNESPLTTECNDGINNDFDGLIDYPEDPGCISELDTSELGTVECDDGTDNDNDTYIDYPSDSDCESATDDSEAGPLPDFIALDLNVPVNLTVGYTYMTEFTVLNNGTDVTTTHDHILLHNGTGCWDWCWIDYEIYSNHSANLTRVVNFTWTPTLSGTYYLKACADGNHLAGSPNSACVLDNVNESDETNNDIYYQVNVQSGTCNDTDGGIVYDISGYIFGEQGGIPFNYTDTCYNSTWINESYCTVSDAPSYILDDCSLNWTSCSNGACV